MERVKTLQTEYKLAYAKHSRFDEITTQIYGSYGVDLTTILERLEKIRNIISPLGNDESFSSIVMLLGLINDNTSISKFQEIIQSIYAVADERTRFYGREMDRLNRELLNSTVARNDIYKITYDIIGTEEQIDELYAYNVKLEDVITLFRSRFTFIDVIDKIPNGFVVVIADIVCVILFKQSPITGNRYLGVIEVEIYVAGHDRRNIVIHELRSANIKESFTRGPMGYIKPYILHGAKADGEREAVIFSVLNENKLCNDDDWF